MRVEPHEVDSFVHIIKRGARGMPITRSDADRKRFGTLLYYLNDEYQGENWERDIRDLQEYERPDTWPKRDPLVAIQAWVLMPNHFHLILKQIKNDGISRFMQRLGGSMSAHFNAKYKEQGSIFQGAYKGRTIGSDEYLRWVAPYVMVKNVFELYSGGFIRAVQNFERAWKWGTETYQYSSLPDFSQGRSTPIIDITLMKMYSSREFKALARDMITGHAAKKGLDVSNLE